MFKATASLESIPHGKEQSRKMGAGYLTSAKKSERGKPDLQDRRNTWNIPWINSESFVEERAQETARRFTKWLRF